MRESDQAEGPRLMREAIRAARAYQRDPQDPTVELRLPFDGPWLTVRTPAHRVPSHGTHFGGQTYAFDFVALDQRGRPAAERDWRSLVATEDPDRFIGFGKPILAPATGHVVAVHDGEVDHEARRSPLPLLAYAVTQAARLRQGLSSITGNYIILAVEQQPAFVLLAHLQRGSIGVAVGAQVRVGDRLAACGNSGNSTQPHLHVQAMDSRSLLRARGLPVVFCDYAEWSADKSAPQRIPRGIPRRRWVVESIQD